VRTRLRFRVRQARYHITRRRYWRRMRGPLPQRDQHIDYSRQRWVEIQDAYERRAYRGCPARTVRTRT
jgi:hypothetical protein